MKFLKAFVLTLCFTAAAAFAQDGKSKVAFYFVSDEPAEGIYRPLGGQIVTAIIEGGQYAAMNRTAELKKLLAADKRRYQMSGVVEEDQMSKLGKAWDAKYVISIEMSKSIDGFYIESKMTDVEEVYIAKMSVIDTKLQTSQDVAAVAGRIVEELLGVRAAAPVYAPAPETVSAPDAEFEPVRESASAQVSAYEPARETAQTQAPEPELEQEEQAPAEIEIKIKKRKYGVGGTFSLYRRAGDAALTGSGWSIGLLTSRERKSTQVGAMLRTSSILTEVHLASRTYVKESTERISGITVNSKIELTELTLSIPVLWQAHVKNYYLESGIFFDAWMDADCRVTISGSGIGSSTEKIGAGRSSLDFGVIIGGGLKLGPASLGVRSCIGFTSFQKGGNKSFTAPLELFAGAYF